MNDNVITLLLWVGVLVAPGGFVAVWLIKAWERGLLSSRRMLIGASVAAGVAIAMGAAGFLYLSPGPARRMDDHVVTLLLWVGVLMAPGLSIAGWLMRAWERGRLSAWPMLIGASAAAGATTGMGMGGFLYLLPGPAELKIAYSLGGAAVVAALCAALLVWQYDRITWKGRLRAELWGRRIRS